MRLHQQLPLFACVILCADAAAQQDPPGKLRVDLSDEQVEPQTTQQAPHRHTLEGLAKQWFENVQIHGFGSMTYLDSGSDGWRPDGAMMIKDAGLFLEADATTNTSLYVQVLYARAGSTDDRLVRTREVYVHFRDLLDDDGSLNVKVGSFDIPFGEDYLRRDSIYLPTINYSAAEPYGTDEGVLAYGKLSGLEWYAAAMDGSIARGQDDGGDKAYALKLAGRPMSGLYLSGSVMHTGKTTRAASCFGGVFLTPVGNGSPPSSAGVSSSAKISALLSSLNATIGSTDDHYLMLSVGDAHISDSAPGFDRDLTWFAIEPSLRLTESIYVTARYSEFGTYDDREGYLLNGKLTAAGRAGFGWDAKRLQRIGLTFGYNPHKNLWIKAEVGRDRFWVIEQSALTPGSQNRHFFGFEVVVGF